MEAQKAIIHLDEDKIQGCCHGNEVEAAPFPWANPISRLTKTEHRTCVQALPDQSGEPKPAQPFPGELNKWPWDDGECDKDNVNLFGWGHYKTGCFSSVFYVGWTQSSSSLTLLVFGSWVREAARASVHRHKSCLCSQSWVIIFEERNQELEGIGFSALNVPQQMILFFL